MLIRFLERFLKGFLEQVQRSFVANAPQDDGGEKCHSEAKGRRISRECEKCQWLDSASREFIKVEPPISEVQPFVTD